MEQVVNPKIYKVFKAQLDRAVCEFLGMDYDAWVEKLRQRDELKQQIHQLEQQKKHQQQMAQNPADKSKFGRCYWDEMEMEQSRNLCSCCLL